MRKENNIIYVDTRGTNSGKTTDAILNRRHELEELLGKKFENVFLLVPTKLQKQQLLAPDYRYSDKVQPLSYYGSMYDEGCIFATSYAELSARMRDKDESKRVSLKDSLVICDEFPTLIDYSCYQQQHGEFLEYLMDKDLFESTTIFAMSGTPQIMFDYCRKLELPYKFVDFTPSPILNIHADNADIYNRGSAKTYAKKLIFDGFNKTKVFYVDSATESYSLYKMFKAAGKNAAFIVSQDCKRYVLDKEDANYGKSLTDVMNSITFNEREREIRLTTDRKLNIFEYIKEKSDIPKGLDVLIFNAAAREGINIMDNHNRVDEVVIQSADRAAIEQARARVRHDIEKLTIIYNRSFEGIHRANYEDVMAWYAAYKKNPSKEMLEERYRKQVEATEEYEAWCERQRKARDNFKEFNEPEPQVYDYIVNHSSLTGNYYLNKFCLAQCQYQVDNYTFATKPQTSFEIDECGNEVETTVMRQYTGNEFISPETMASRLQHMSNSRIKVKCGKELANEVNNSYKISLSDLELFLDRKLFKEDKKELVNTLNLTNSQGRKCGWPTVKQCLESMGYTVKESNTMVKGKSKRYSLIQAN